MDCRNCNYSFQGAAFVVDLLVMPLSIKIIMHLIYFHMVGRDCNYIFSEIYNSILSTTI